MKFIKVNTMESFDYIRDELEIARDELLTAMDAMGLHERFSENWMAFSKIETRLENLIKDIGR